MLRPWLPLISFVFLLLCLPFAYDRYAESRILTHSSAAHLRTFIESSESRVVAVGTSRFAAGLHPDIFGPNFAIASTPFMDIDIMLAFVTRYADTFQKKDLIILEYHPEMALLRTLHKQPELRAEIEEYDVPVDALLEEKNPLRLFSVAALFPNLVRLRLSPRDLVSVQDRDKELMKIPEKIRQWQLVGFKPTRQLPDQNELFRVAKSFLEIQQQHLPARLFDEGRSKILNLIQFLGEKKISYCWLEMPNRPEISQVQDSAWPGELSLYQERILPHACATRFWVRGQAKDLQYGDPVHLYVDSAFSFSQNLKEEMIQRSFIF